MAATSGVLGRQVPAARVTGLVVTEASDEVLVYDTERHHIHHLNQVTAVIWRSLEEAGTVSEVARVTSMTLGSHVDEATVRLALTTLADAELLDGDLTPDVRVAGQSRRRFLKKAAIAGAAVPLIASVTAPTAGASASCTTPSGGCANNGQCPTSCVCTGTGNPSNRTCAPA